MKIAIIGSGALGLLWGARLTQKNLHTVLITRTQAQQQQLLKQGLIFTPHQQATMQIPVKAISIEENLAQWQSDLVFVMVKQPQLAGVISRVQQISHRNSQIVFWQNGLGHEEQIAKLQHRPYTYAAVTTEGAWKKRAHHVVQTGWGETRIGSFPIDHQPIRSYLSELFSLRSSTPFSLRYDLQIQQRIWEKLTINSLINPLTAYYGILNGELLADFYRKIMEALLDETVAVAHQQGIQLHSQEMMLQTVQVCQNTAHNVSSMLQDVRKGVQTEIDYINGAVVKLGKRTGIATPVHAEWVQRIREKEKSKGT
jgi:2-dehydropantoate 2-reductase